MAATLQVIYPADPGTRFDHDYYTGTHLPLVEAKMGAHIRDALVVRGSGAPGGGPAPFHAVATLIFADAAARDAALAVAGPVVEDIANFTDCTPQMLLGDTL
ncbi:EthD family reductase [Mangrovicoccus algicola]|uniref:EthD family reductase n=1 Tax=Mangrovicoccus algicola TaxID=2771008 RepID=A0A8J6Z5T9_9RHOB|nr:EthD family reductase [Mangrovicoccus algicola]MBE3636890.1 EthD family reductase [Mangrovicoccus algicola]